MRLCVIEDETAIALPLKRILEKEGFAVDYADNGEQGLNYIRLNQYDCVILDLHLPKIDGMSVLAQIRAANINTPVIILTARSQMYDKIEGFQRGADDYLTKPFHWEELIARVRAVIKRASSNPAMALRFGQYTFYPERNVVQSVTKTGRTEIILTTKETAILEYLLRHPDRVISTEELLEHVWDQEVNLFTDTVKTHMKTLRQKIDPNKQWLVTIRGKGYKISQV
jgi:DNA-binding response OmpR family regulator